MLGGRADARRIGLDLSVIDYSDLETPFRNFLRLPTIQEVPEGYLPKDRDRLVVGIPPFRVGRLPLPWHRGCFGRGFGAWLQSHPPSDLCLGLPGLGTRLFRVGLHAHGRVNPDYF